MALDLDTITDQIGEAAAVIETLHLYDTEMQLVDAVFEIARTWRDDLRDDEGLNAVPPGQDFTHPVPAVTISDGRLAVSKPDLVSIEGMGAGTPVAVLDMSTRFINAFEDVAWRWAMTDSQWAQLDRFITQLRRMRDQRRTNLSLTPATGDRIRRPPTVADSEDPSPAPPAVDTVDTSTLSLTVWTGQPRPHQLVDNDTGAFPPQVTV